MIDKTLEVLVDGPYIAKGRFSEVDYSNLMEYLTGDHPELGKKVPKGSAPFYRSCLLTGAKRRESSSTYYFEKDVSVKYIAKEYVDKNKPGKTYCTIKGPAKEVARIKQIMLDTLESNAHEAE